MGEGRPCPSRQRSTVAIFEKLDAHCTSFGTLYGVVIITLTGLTSRLKQLHIADIKCVKKLIMKLVVSREPLAAHSPL